VEQRQRAPGVPEEVRLARHLVLNASLAGDCESVAQALLQVARNDLMTRDLTLGAIRRALQALVVHYPVYRTYISACGRPARTRGSSSRPWTTPGRPGEADWPLLDHLAQWLGGQPGGACPRAARKHLRHACVRFQQLTAPSAAKAVEDTAFYRSAAAVAQRRGLRGRAFSADPALPQRGPAAPARLPRQPAGHRHPRPQARRRHPRAPGGAQRARPWLASRVEHWRELAAPLRAQLDDGAAPSPGDELMLWQTLLGSWPLDLDLHDDNALRHYAERIASGNRRPCAKPSCAAAGRAERGLRRRLRPLHRRPAAGRENQQLRKSLADAAQLLACPGALNGLVQACCA
jgi:(1->4)-alpha-D-glucan 1-alpha-D-glucosylmutase